MIRKSSAARARLALALGALLFTACSSNQGAPRDSGLGDGRVTFEVPAAGGTFATPQGEVTIEVPAGAVPAGTEITVQPRVSYPEDRRIVPGTVFELGPHGVTFAAPLHVVIRYDPRRIPAGIVERRLRLHKLVDRELQPLGGDVDTEADEAWAEVTSFSTILVGEQALDDELGVGDGPRDAAVDAPPDADGQPADAPHDHALPADRGDADAPAPADGASDAPEASVVPDALPTDLPGPTDLLPGDADAQTDADVGACAGCLDPYGVCQLGMSPDACGAGGVACATCTGGQCWGGTCCAGCWSGTTASCAAGTTTAQCGSGGAACGTCAAGVCQVASCATGSCQLFTAADGTGCAGGTCVGGACVPSGPADAGPDAPAEAGVYPDAGWGDAGLTCPPDTFVCGWSCCPAGGICCDDNCISPLSDRNNCGGCGQACTVPTKDYCQMGVCSCNPPHFSDCGSYCAYLSADPDNCGSCGTVCPSDKRWCNGFAPAGSQCVACADVGRTYCVNDNLCADLSFDNDHCGSCDTQCLLGEACVNGSCVAGNSGGSGVDGGVAPDAGLGDGGPTCPADTFVCGWSCCPAGGICCDDNCISPLSDPSNCGGCSQACTVPTKDYCQMGVCSCNPPHFSDCGSYCAYLSADPDNCGSCGTVCPNDKRWCNGFAPAGSQCVACADVGRTYCANDNLCADLAFDNDHCGSCDTQCVLGEACVSGTCVTGNSGGGGPDGGVSPDAGLSDGGPTCPANTFVCGWSCCPAGGICCDDNCISPLSDRNNCGGCGQACTVPTKDYCQMGVCSCNPPHFSDCGSYCAYLAADPDNCGSCGTVCPNDKRWCNGFSPAGSQCVACADVGRTYCANDNLCADLAFDNDHCGSCDTQCVLGEACVSGTCVAGN